MNTNGSKDKKLESKKEIVVTGVFIFVFTILLFNNPLWSDRDGATLALKNAGYREVEILPYDFFYRCGRNGPIITRFKATLADGKNVTGAVCRSLFGSDYIKIDR